jgi:hypothetical protein
MLDEWFRDLCYNYKNMPASARTLIRQFLHFDMSKPLDIFYQDQLAWGTIENTQKSTTPMIVLQQNILSSVPEDVKDEINDNMSQADSFRGGGGGGVSKKVETSNKFQPKQKEYISDTRSVMSSSRRDNNQNTDLQNLIWETASQGGKSKLPIREASASRTVITSMR